MTKFTESQRAQWEEEGYLLFDNAIQGGELARLQRALTTGRNGANPNG